MEITNAMLYRALNLRAERESRELRRACERAERKNRVIESWLDGDRACLLVFGSELQEGTLGQTTTTDEQRKNLARFCADLRYAHEPDGDFEHTVRRECPDYKRDERSHGNSHGPRPKQEVSSGWCGY